MGMHPKIQDDKAKLIFNLLFGVQRQLALEEAIKLGLVCDKNYVTWHKLIEDLQDNNNFFQNTIDYFKLNIDSIIDNKSFLSSKSAKGIVENLILTADIFGIDFKNVDNLRGKTVLDFGAGIYRTLSQAVILYCNGFDRVIAYEPYKLNENFVIRSHYHLIEMMANSPKEFIFSSINQNEYLSRLRSFIDLGTSERIKIFNSEENGVFQVGSCFIYKNLRQIESNSIDVHFSNAVLEHVMDINKDMSELHKLSRSDAVGIHTVDFLDHRHYDDHSIFPMEKYYDGVLDEINGLTPSELESKISSSGWEVIKGPSQFLPDNLLHSEKRSIIERYSNFNEEELSEHVNRYFLKKK